MKIKIDLNKPDEIKMVHLILTSLLGGNVIDRKPAAVEVITKGDASTTKANLKPKVNEPSKQAGITEQAGTTEQVGTTETPKTTNEALRLKTQQKIVLGFRDDIKKKIAEFKTNSVTNMKPEHWDTFNEFLDNLK